jgi:hypothetical protein
MTPQDGAGLPARERLIAAAELVLAMALVFGANVLDIVPVSETPWLVLVGWLSLRLRGLGWRSVGFTRPASWPRAIAVALVAAVVLQLASEYVVEPLVERWTGETPDLSQFRPLIGNLPAALGIRAGRFRGGVGLWWLVARRDPNACARAARGRGRVDVAVNPLDFDDAPGGQRLVPAELRLLLRLGRERRAGSASEGRERGQCCGDESESDCELHSYSSGSEI